MAAALPTTPLRPTPARLDVATLPRLQVVTPAVLPCPRCEQTTDSLKLVNTPILLFIVLGWALQKREIIGCPDCCQKAVVRGGVINLVTANIFWPLIILPSMLFNLLRTTSPGHDHELLNRLRLPVPETPPGPVRPLHEAFPFLCRFVGVVELLLGLYIGAATLVPALTYDRPLSPVGLAAAGYLVVAGVARLLLIKTPLAAVLAVFRRRAAR